jgi:murein DD-endopeptidase MepM/ murein hydrolase activator NlpD
VADVAELTAAQAAAADELLKLEERVARAQAALAEAKAQSAAVQDSYDDYLKEQEAKRIAEKKAAAARLAKSKVTPVASGRYEITARFGQSGSLWSSGSHTGLDFAAPTGTPVRAATSGRVTSTGWAGPYGNQVQIDHGNGVVTTYNHLSSISVSPGDKVTTKDRIGKVGSTGNSTGAHLHFEVLRDGSHINPASWLGL